MTNQQSLASDSSNKHRLYHQGKNLVNGSHVHTPLQTHHRLYQNLYYDNNGFIKLSPSLPSAATTSNETAPLTRRVSVSFPTQECPVIDSPCP